MPTMRDTFNKVKNHLLTQMERCVEDRQGHSFCLYRGPRGLKCAVGCLIPDHLYNPEMDDAIGTRVGTMLQRYKGLKEYLIPDQGESIDTQLHMLYRLQAIHDDCNDVREWKDELDYIEDEFFPVKHRGLK